MEEEEEETGIRRKRRMGSRGRGGGRENVRRVMQVGRGVTSCLFSVLSE